MIDILIFILKLYSKSKEHKAKKIKVEKDPNMFENPPSSFFSLMVNLFCIIYFLVLPYLLLSNNFIFQG